MSDKRSSLAVGDEVRFLHSRPLGGVISSIDEDGAMVCMPVGLNYQLRGPVALSDLEKSPRGMDATAAAGGFPPPSAPRSPGRASHDAQERRT